MTDGPMDGSTDRPRRMMRASQQLRAEQRVDERAANIIVCYRQTPEFRSCYRVVNTALVERCDVYSVD